MVVVAEYPAPGQCARVYGDVSSWGTLYTLADWEETQG